MADIRGAMPEDRLTVCPTLVSTRCERIERQLLDIKEISLISSWKILDFLMHLTHIEVLSLAGAQ